jgi:hypothetical protein
VLPHSSKGWAGSTGSSDMPYKTGVCGMLAVRALLASTGFSMFDNRSTCNSPYVQLCC